MNQLQKEGREFTATLECEHLNEPEDPVARLDLTRAYPLSELTNFRRSFHVNRSGHIITLIDEFSFNRLPDQLEEAFITFALAEIIDNGLGVKLTRHGETLMLRAQQPGMFESRFVAAPGKMTETCSPDHPDQPGFFRIGFKPETLAETMRLSFIFE
ncbi:MAG: hypothetical protein D6820_03025 [Lentisphaerae bacterium]|nr:MAG: hypothetical protein D6820_03025 [Lentisphaerota bacterium]